MMRSVDSLILAIHCVWSSSNPDSSAIETLRPKDANFLIGDNPLRAWYAIFQPALEFVRFHPVCFSNQTTLRRFAGHEDSV
jgi:hypothetical protein